MPINPQRPLTELLAELEAAVRIGDRLRAVQLQQTILQRLATEAAEHAAIERRVRKLMAQLAPDAPRRRGKGVHTGSLGRSGHAARTRRLFRGLSA